MEKTTRHNSLFLKAMVILLIVSLVFTTTTVFAEDDDLQANPVSVTLDPNGGQFKDTIINPIILTDDTYSEVFTELGSIKPVRTGYTFTGWFSSPSGGTQITQDTQAPSEEHTIYAQWKANVYTVNFSGNGGSVSKKSMPVTFGKTYGSLATASRSGYGFIGWYTASGTKIYSSTSYNTAGNITLYAKWGRKYKIYFNGNNGKVSQKSKTVVKGLTYGTLPKPSRKGYTFTGWYTRKSGGTKISATNYVGISKNTTLYARWKRTNYLLKFDPRGGKASKTQKYVNYKKKYGKLPKVSRKGYVFKGWFTKKSGGSKITSKSTYKLTKGRTLYAKWRAKRITIKFNANKGRVSKRSKTVSYNKKFGKLPKPKRSSYKFKGWFSKKSGGVRITSSTKMKYTKKKTIYARWAKVSTVKFNYNKGKKGKTKSKRVVYGEKYGSLPSTKRAGYIFKGWYTKKSGGTLVKSSSIVKTKKNITLYARWEFTLNISKMYAPYKSKCRPGSPMKFVGVTIHNTGNTASTADALNHARYLQNGGSKKSASWHYCVDESRITQSIPENEIAWHAGDGGLGFGNTRTVAIEICMNKGGDLKAATDRAAKLTAYILGKNGIKTAISKKNLFQHNYHSGKNCPEMIRSGKPYNWSSFVSKVNYYL